ncbi:cephalosporin hydroxylase family protein [Marinoscillum furvescens]|uniref:Cephalosporin hydroxylase n=1 Tax=Marinoscillum furvescens DSM 4134 TaxID=1122208 RepID=A0A3D9L0C0_MARFU|nr:cephalosporin hydroxylase family protein [Marinoscillum furvescens]RED96626.1 cephalosporin hydroxylase [Marinoscillum furvescens DSM 4134]
MDQIENFKKEVKNRIASYQDNQRLKATAKDFMLESIKEKYSYNFSWLGRPIIQYPQDIMALQEIIWTTKPDLIIETGIAHGGSLIFSASMLKLTTGKGKVLGVDIDIRNHNKEAIMEHPLYKEGWIEMIEGSSIDQTIFDKIKSFAKSHSKVMVILDSNHTHEHVLDELKLYSTLVTKGNYLAVMDTMVEDFDDSLNHDRPWAVGNNPKTAVKEFLKGNDTFVINEQIDNQLLLSVAPSGYLLKV